MNRIILFGLALLLTFTLTTPMQSMARSAPKSFADLVEKLIPTVVNISTSQEVPSRGGIIPGFPHEKFNPDDLPEPFRDFFRFYDTPNQEEEEEAPSRKAQSLGSGFVIDPQGYIITNNHVIDEADEITVTLSDERKLEAKIIGHDPKTDVALLKVDVGNTPLKAIEFGDSDKARVGDWVIAIGNPFSLGSSVSAGIISARARDINAGPFDDFIQTDAAINKGNSGGPLFNSEGELIGINTAIVSPSGGNVGIGFAIPTSLVEPVIEQLKKHGRTYRAWLGVQIRKVTKDLGESVGLKKPAGAFVEEVIKGSPADKGGIRPADVILSFDGKKIQTMRKLPRMVAETEIGKKVDIQLFRNGQYKKVTVTLAELEESNNKVASKKPLKKKDVMKNASTLLGMSLVPYSKNVKSHYKIDKKVKSGLIVVNVDKKSNANEKGIRAGDVIISANQQELDYINDLKEIIKTAKKSNRSNLLLFINRNGKTKFVAVRLKK